jgi:hypothetical protein
MAEYLRAQAATCLLWSRDCFDLTVATRLRLLAEELMAKAAELEAGSSTAHAVRSHVHSAASHRAGSFATRKNAS